MFKQLWASCCVIKVIMFKQLFWAYLWASCCIIKVIMFKQLFVPCSQAHSQVDTLILKI